MKVYRQCGFNRRVLNSKRTAYVHASCLLPLHINAFCWPLKVNMFQVKTSWTPSWPGHYEWSGTRGLPLSSYKQIPSSNNLLFRSSPIMHNWQLQECHHTHTYIHTYSHTCTLARARTHTHTNTHTHLSFYCPAWATRSSKKGRDRNSKSRPPHYQGTPRQWSWHSYTETRVNPAVTCTLA